MEIKSASDIDSSVPETGVGAVGSMNLDISGGSPRINTVSDADVGPTPNESGDRGIPVVITRNVDEGESGNIRSATE